MLYGLAAAQLGDDDTPLSFAGIHTTVSGLLEAMFGYHYWMRWWCVLIVAAYILFMRVASILALRYINFLRR